MSHGQFRFVWGARLPTSWHQRGLLRRCGPNPKGNPHNCMTAWEEHGPCSQKGCCGPSEGFEIWGAWGLWCAAEVVGRGGCEQHRVL